MTERKSSIIAICIFYQSLGIVILIYGIILQSKPIAYTGFILFCAFFIILMLHLIDTEEVDWLSFHENYWKDRMGGNW